MQEYGPCRLIRFLVEIYDSKLTHMNSVPEFSMYQYQLEQAFIQRIVSDRFRTRDPSSLNSGSESSCGRWRKGVESTSKHVNTFKQM